MTRPVTLVAVALTLAILAGLAGRTPHALDAAAAFRMHLAGLALLGAACAFALRRLRAAGLLAGVALLGILVTPVAFAPAARPAAPGPTRPLTVLLANVHHSNPDLPRLAEMLAAPAADVIVTLETPEALLSAPQLAPWPHRVKHIDRPGRFGPVIWSRTPFLADDPLASAGRHPRHVIARLAPSAPEAPALQIAGFHLSRPVMNDQSAELMDLHRFWPRFAAPLILVGDFNAAPWSYALNHVRRMSRTDVLGGYRPSWGGPLGLAIDHVMVSPGIGADGVETLPIPGSDHRALLARLSIPTAAP